MDKFLSTSSGSINISDGTVDIYAESLRAENLTAGMPLKTDGKKNIVSEFLTTSDIIGLDDLNTKSYIDFVQGAGHTPATGHISIYAKTGEDRLFTQDENSVEHQVGDVFTTSQTPNNSLAVWQGGSGKHLGGSNIHYNTNTSGLENVQIISNGTAEVVLGQTGDITLAASLIASNGDLNMNNNTIYGASTINGIIPSTIILADGSVPMTGNLNMSVQNINNLNEISLNVINKQGSQDSIRVNTNPYFDISGGQFGSILRLIADESNINNDAGEIHFYQDGNTLSGGVLMDGANKTMNVVSCGNQNLGGIAFKVGGLSNNVYDAPTKMTIGQNGDVVLEDSIRIKSINELEFGFGDATKNQFSGRCSYKGFSLFALDFVGAAVGAADRQVQIYEDLTLKAVIQTSDERLKKNIRPLELKVAAELIDGLKPKCFQWKNIDRLTGEEREFTDHHCYMGLIAQEVKTVQDTIGDAMNEKLRISRNAKNEKDFMSVSYTQLIAPMMKCIQDLRTRVAALEQRLDNTV